MDKYYCKDSDQLEFILNRETGRWVIGKNLDRAPIEYLDKPLDSRIEDVNPIVLQITNKCNLACEYCYASDWLGQEDTSLETGKLALDRTTEAYERGKNGITKHVVFHGGEPLLNLSLIKALVAYAKNKKYKFDFGLQTNGILLDQNTLNFLREHNIKPCISLDGFDMRTNAARKYANGENAFGLVYSNLNAIPRDMYRAIIAVITKHNVNFLEKLLNTFVEQEIRSVHLTPVKTLNRKCCSPSNTELYTNIANVFERYEAKKLPIEIRNFKFIAQTLFTDHLPKSCTLCGVGRFQPLVIDVNGDIYPCDMCVGQSEFKLGNIADTSLKKANDSKDNFRNTRSPKIEGNWSRLHTNGCPIDAYFKTGDINSSDEYLEYYERIYDHFIEKLLVDSR